jgi:hypothetical protein
MYTLSLIKARTLCHEDMLGIGGIPPPFLTSTLDRGEWSASHSGHFTAGEIAPFTHWIGGCTGSRARLDAVESNQESNPGRPVHNR